MKRHLIMLGCIGLALASCTTTGGQPRNDVEARWVGKSAGTFFASYGPPISDSGEGGGVTEYSWKGGYKTARVPAQYAEGENGKKGKRISPAQTRYLSCTLKLSVDSSYTIRSVTIVSDRPGEKGKSYCAEYLDAAS